MKKVLGWVVWVIWFLFMGSVTAFGAEVGKCYDPMVLERALGSQGYLPAAQWSSSEYGLFYFIYADDEGRSLLLVMTGPDSVCIANEGESFAFNVETLKTLTRKDPRA